MFKPKKSGLNSLTELTLLQDKITTTTEVAENKKLLLQKSAKLIHKALNVNGLLGKIHTLKYRGRKIELDSRYETFEVEIANTSGSSYTFSVVRYKSYTNAFYTTDDENRINYFIDNLDGILGVIADYIKKERNSLLKDNEKVDNANMKLKIWTKILEDTL